MGAKYRGPFKEWGEGELALVREHYPQRGSRWGGWARLLPDRSPSAISHKASDLGLKHQKSWTDTEEAVLKLYYPNKNKDWEGWRRLLPGRTRRQVITHANSMGLKSPRGGRYGGWTDEQRRRLLLAVSSVADETGHTMVGCIKELNNMRLRAGERRREEHA